MEDEGLDLIYFRKSEIINGVSERIRQNEQVKGKIVMAQQQLKLLREAMTQIDAPQEEWEILESTMKRLLTNESLCSQRLGALKKEKTALDTDARDASDDDWTERLKTPKDTSSTTKSFVQQKMGELFSKNDNDEDLMVVGEADNFMCPLTQGPLEDPVHNKACGHRYSRNAIKSHIKASRRNDSSAPCPVAGCRYMVRMSDLEKDAEAEFWSQRKKTHG